MNKDGLASSHQRLHTEAMEEIYIGIDGGGTRTRLGIMDREGTVLHRNEGASANIYAVGEKTAKSYVTLLLDESLEEFKGRTIGGFCFGSAGLGREEERLFWQTFFDGYFKGTVTPILVSDALLLLAGALPQRAGLCLISGTGSICIGRNEEGTVVRSGGFGTVLGDEGSAWWIAREAIKRSLASLEGREEATILTDELRRKIPLKRFEEVIGWANAKERTKDDIASLAPVVTNAAEDGDGVAIRILEEAIAHLIALIEATERRLPPTWPHHVGLGGGVLEWDRYIRPRLRERLSARWELFSTKDAALNGAMVMALEGVQGTVASKSSSS